MNSERAVVACILGVMVCLTGAMFYAGFSPDPHSLEQPVGPNKPMPPAPKVVVSTSAALDGSDSWIPPEAFAAAPSPAPVPAPNAALTSHVGVAIPSVVGWSSPAGGDTESASSLAPIASLGGQIRVSFEGTEGIMTLAMPSELTADADGDGELTAADLEAFTDKWETMGPDADFNGDGIVDAFDMAAFVDAFASGETRTVARLNEAGNFQIQLTDFVAKDVTEVRGLVLRAVAETEEAK